MIKNYLSLVKFSHTIFAMPFAMIGFVLGLTSYNYWRTYLSTEEYSMVADLTPDLSDYPKSFQEILIRLLLVVLCMVFARSAAMAFNRFLDASFDAVNPRTAIREIPAGIISKDNALRFVLFNCIAFIICTWFINRVCFYLSPVALFVVLFYSFTKRFTPLSHLVLGLGLSLAPIGAFLAVTGQFSLIPVMLSVAVLLWVSGFDIIYALQDEEFDRLHQLHSIPASVGKVKAMRISEALHTFCALLLLAIYVKGDFGWWYLIGWLIFITMLTYQHAIVKADDLSKVNVAFFTTNGIASILFAVFVILDLFV